MNVSRILKSGGLFCSVFPNPFSVIDESKRKLRLYCIHYGSVLLVLGGGGTKNVRALQDDQKLKKEITFSVKYQNA